MGSPTGARTNAEVLAPRPAQPVLYVPPGAVSNLRDHPADPPSVLANCWQLLSLETAVVARPIHSTETICRAVFDLVERLRCSERVWLGIKPSA